MRTHAARSLHVMFAKKIRFLTLSIVERERHRKSALFVPPRNLGRERVREIYDVKRKILRIHAVPLSSLGINGVRHHKAF